MLKLINISKEFRNGKEKIIALNNFSYKFKSNGFYAVLGPSGSGKTTLLNIIASLDSKVSGSIIYKNKDIIKYKEAKRIKYRKKDIGMIYQNPNLIPYLSLKDNISLNKIKDYSVIEKLGIKQLLKRDITKLSGGQRQRIALARALSNNPYILLADEPTGALDQNNSNKVMEILREEAKDKLVIIVSHDASLCRKYCDVILSLNEGKLVKEEIIKNIGSIHIKKRKNRVKQSITKLAFSFLKYKRKRTFLASFCCSIGLIGVMLSLILSQGFSSFFKMQFDNSLNANSLYGYPRERDSINSISLHDVQDIALTYNLKWGVFYEASELMCDVMYEKEYIEWLNVTNLFHYRVDESINIKSNLSFILSFPRSYSYIISSLINKPFYDESEINNYIKNNDIYFDFIITNNDEIIKIKLKLEYIKWNESNKIEIIQNNHFWIEDLSNIYNFIIESDLDKKGIIRYPYIYDYKENDIDRILVNKKYLNITFNFDVDYIDKKIIVAYYSKIGRISKEYLEEFLVYDEVLDYIYLSSNGVSLELNMPNIMLNNIKGRDISYSSLDLNNIKGNYVFSGNIPTNDNEIIVSKTLLNNLNVSLNSNVKVKHILNLETKVKIVGYIEGNSANIIYQKGSWTYNFFKDELNIPLKDFICYQISLHLKQKDNIPYYVSFLTAQYEEYEFISPLYEASKEINKLMNYFENGILALSLFSIFVSLLLVGIIIFLNTIEQKKYDAIFLMRGYSKKKIIRMHILQNILISLLAFLITVLMSYFIVVEVNTIFSLMINISYYSFANISLSTLLILLISLLTCALISGYIPLLFLKLDDPLKILKE